MKLNGSWQTTTMGVIGIVIAVANAISAFVDGNPATNVDFAVLITQITMGLGLIKARDNGVSSEEAGAK